MRLLLATTVLLAAAASLAGAPDLDPVTAAPRRDPKRAAFDPNRPTLLCRTDLRAWLPTAYVDAWGERGPPQSADDFRLGSVRKVRPPAGVCRVDFLTLRRLGVPRDEALELLRTITAGLGELRGDRRWMYANLRLKGWDADLAAFACNLHVDGAWGLDALVTARAAGQLDAYRARLLDRLDEKLAVIDAGGELSSASESTPES